MTLRPQTPEVRPLGYAYAGPRRGEYSVTESLRVDISGYPDSDLQERAALAAELTDELEELGMATVATVESEAPAEAKGPALEWAQLVVATVGTLPGLIAFVQAWVNRRPGSSLTLDIKGDRLEIKGGTSAERAEARAAWLARNDVS